MNLSCVNSYTQNFILDHFRFQVYSQEDNENIASLLHKHPKF